MFEKEMNDENLVDFITTALNREPIRQIFNDEEMSEFINKTYFIYVGTNWDVHFGSFAQAHFANVDQTFIYTQNLKIVYLYNLKIGQIYHHNLAGNFVPYEKAFSQGRF